MRESMPAIAQPNLFESAPTPAALAGLTYVSEAITPAREQEIVRFVETLEFTQFAFRGFTGKRRTVSVG
jgi:hypothetical protein